VFESLTVKIIDYDKFLHNITKNKYYADFLFLKSIQNNELSGTSNEFFI
jgi:hypothetical protein